MKKLSVLFALPIAILLLACGPYGPSFSDKAVNGIAPGQSTMAQLLERYPAELHQISFKRIDGTNYAAQCVYGKATSSESEAVTYAAVISIQNADIQFETEALQGGLNSLYESGTKITKIRLGKDSGAYGMRGLMLGFTDLVRAKEILGDGGKVSADGLSILTNKVQLTFTKEDWSESPILTSVELSA